MDLDGFDGSLSPWYTHHLAYAGAIASHLYIGRDDGLLTRLWAKELGVLKHIIVEVYYIVWWSGRNGIVYKLGLDLWYCWIFIEISVIEYSHNFERIFVFTFLYFIKLMKPYNIYEPNMWFYITNFHNYHSLRSSVCHIIYSKTNNYNKYEDDISISG